MPEQQAELRGRIAWQGAVAVEAEPRADGSIAARLGAFTWRGGPITLVSREGGSPRVVGRVDRFWRDDEQPGVIFAAGEYWGFDHVPDTWPQDSAAPKLSDVAWAGAEFRPVEYGPRTTAPFDLVSAELLSVTLCDSPPWDACEIKFADWPELEEPADTEGDADAVEVT